MRSDYHNYMLLSIHLFHICVDNPSPPGVENSGMATLVETLDTLPLSASLDAPMNETDKTRLLRKRGPNRIPLSFRHDVEKVYLAMDGSRGLYEWAIKNADIFYPLVLKISAMFEVKETVSADPVRVFVYANDGSHVEITNGSPAKTLDTVLDEPTTGSDPIPLVMQSNGANTHE